MSNGVLMTHQIFTLETYCRPMDSQAPARVKSEPLDEMKTEPTDCFTHLLPTGELLCIMSHDCLQHAYDLPMNCIELPLVWP